MKLHVCLLLFFGLAISEAKIASKCPHERTLEADQCAKKGFLLFNPDWEGHQGNSADHYCESIKSSLSCVEKFNKDCLRGEVKNAAVLGLSGMKKHQKFICGPNPQRKQEFFQKTKWITKKEIDVLYSCVQAFITNMNYIVTNTLQIPENKRIPQSCCNYDLARSCLSQKIKKMSNETNQNFLETLTDYQLKDLLDYLSCENSSACENMSTAKERMEATFKNPGSKPNMESFLMSFLEVISSLV